MLGRKLTDHLLACGTVAGQALDSLMLVDVVQPQTPDSDNIQISAKTADLSQSGVAGQLIEDKPDLIFHLAAIVSGEAERDMQKGYRINLDGTRELLEAIGTEHEKSGYRPKLIFTSSIAVYGIPLPKPIDDEFHLTPLSSYGTQKAMCELLLADYNRRGIVQGIGLRLPTICIRPGKPNAAASGFYSGILREPINGQSAILPVEDTVRHWFASPRAAVGFFMHAASLEPEQIGARCNFNLPGLSATVADQIESLRTMIGSDAVALIKRKADPSVASLVSGWPESFNPERAIKLGFKAEASFNEIIQVYLDDDFQGT